MKIGIIGAGAMGCLFGGYLAKAGETVWLLGRSADHINRIKEHGLTILHDNKSSLVPLEATNQAGEIGLCDTAIICTKYKHTRTALENASPLIGPKTSVITLQNGLGNTEIICKYVNKDNICAGITTLGAVKRQAGEIEITHLDKAETYLWPLNNKPSQSLQNLVDAFNNSGLSFYLSEDTNAKIWNKLALNSSVSVLTAVTGLKSGDLCVRPEVWKLIEAIVTEIAAVAAQENIIMDTKIIIKELEEITNSSNHAPSILIDVLNKRETEIDCLNGAVVRKAKLYGVKVPVNNTIYSLVRILQDTYDKRVPQFQE